MDKKNLKAYLAWFAICIIWGTTYLAIRVGVQDLPPVLFAGIRWLVAGPVLLLFLKFKGYKLPVVSDLKHLAVVGLLLLGFGNGLVVFAEQWLPSGLTALLITTVPFWVVGIESALPAGPGFNFKIILGLMLGLFGVFLIFGLDVKALLNSENIAGILGLIFADLCWSSGTVYSKYKKVSVHPFMGAAIQMTFAGIALTALGLSLGELPMLQFTPNGIYSFIYLLIFGSFIAYGSYIYAIAHLPVSFVSTYAYINPVIALFLGWLLLDEKLNLTIVIAAAIILIGVMVVKRGSIDKSKMRRV